MRLLSGSDYHVIIIVIGVQMRQIESRAVHLVPCQQLTSVHGDAAGHEAETRLAQLFQSIVVGGIEQTLGVADWSRFEVGKRREEKC